MSNARLLEIWNSVGMKGYAPTEFYNQAAGVTMDDWAQLIYGELSHRGVTH